MNEIKDNSNLDLNNSNKHILNFSTFALKLIEEINIVRRFPASYSKKLQNIMQNYEGNILKVEEYGIKTKEGKKGLQEAISFLKSLKTSLELLTYSEGIKHSPKIYKICSHYMMELI